MDNKQQNPNRYGDSNDPFAVDPRFSTGLMGHSNLPPTVDTSKTPEELEAEADPWLAAYGKNLPPELLTKGRQNALKAFVENPDIESLEEAYSRGGLNPEAAHELKEHLEDVKTGEIAQAWIEANPQYEVCDENSKRMMSYLHAHSLPVTAANLDEAYQALLTKGALITPKNQIKPLTEDEETQIARWIYDGNYETAVGYYLIYSLPNFSVEEVKAAVYKAEFQPLVAEAVYYIFRHSTPDYKHDPEFLRFLEDYLDDRPYSLVLLKEAWNAFKRDGLLKAASYQENEMNLDDLSEEQQENLYRQTLLEKARQTRHGR
jgi:hypothetical protein